MRKLVVLSSLLFCFTLSLFAQPSKTIVGKIVDQKTSQGLAGVTINAGKTKFLSDANGNYKITTTAKIITFSYVGYDNYAATIGSSTTLNVSLVLDTKLLEEVVITGYASERKNKFAGAATTISGKTVNDVPVGSFDQALQGRVPGMLVNSGSGQPGSSATITIRGIQSIQGAGAQPLYVLDGVPITAFDMQTINPDDFESITVLKDANAAALYGARGGTGVIVITSKRGKVGKTQVTYKSQYGYTQAPDFSRLNLMNTKEMLAYEEREKLTGNPGWNYSPKNPLIPAGMDATRKQFMLDSIGNIDINYADIFFRQGVSQSHELNLTGGSDKTRFYLSTALFDQQGIDLGSSLKRYTVRFNLDHTVNKFTLQFNSSLGYSKSKFAEGEIYGNSPRNPFQMTYRAKTYENPYKADGSLNFGSSTSLALKQVANLLEGIQNSSRTTNQIKAVANAVLAYKVFPTLTLKNSSGLNMSSNYANRYINAASFIGSLQTFQSGLAQEAYSIYSEFINTSSAIYDNKFGKHELEAGAYFEMVRGYQNGLGFTLFNLDPRLNETGQGAGTLPTGGATTYPQNSSSAKSGFGIRSYFGSVKYSYDNKYSINGSVRRDGTSRIVNIDNREITTWSAGLTWNALNEKFLKKLTMFNELKFRASYGIIPNIGSISTSSYGAGLASVTNYQGPQVPTFGTTSYAGSTLTGLFPSNPGNPNLKIEYIQKTNLGLDFAFWNNRAKFNIDVYKNLTVDMFVSQPLSGTTGFSTLNINAGKMSNKGVELLAKFEVVKSKNFGLILGINHSMNKNKIEDLGLVNEYFLGTFVIRKGIPYGSHYNYNYLGTDPATGAPLYETLDGATTNDIAKAGQFAKFGNYLPVHQGGFDFDIRYKSFSISGLFSYQFDVVRSNNTRNWITRGTPGYHGAVRASRELIDNQWQMPGDIKKYQASKFDRGFTSSDLQDAKFLRFRNLVVAYQLPQIKGANGKPLFSGGKIYAQGQNLFIWSPWEGLDPEDNNNISLNEYPNPTMFTLGLDINF
jgi:TonB-linked SusC/RagA family outer membrane protein